MKSIEIGNVNTRLERTMRGFSVSRGSWNCVEFSTYEDANDWFEKFIPESL